MIVNKESVYLLPLDKQYIQVYKINNSFIALFSLSLSQKKNIQFAQSFFLCVSLCVGLVQIDSPPSRQVPPPPPSILTSPRPIHPPSPPLTRPLCTGCLVPNRRALPFLYDWISSGSYLSKVVNRNQVLRHLLSLSNVFSKWIGKKSPPILSLTILCE